MSLKRVLLLLALLAVAHASDDDDDAGGDDDGGPSPILMFLNSSLQCTIGCVNTDGTVVSSADINNQLQPQNMANPPTGAACTKVSQNSAGFLKSNCLANCNSFTKKLLTMSSGSDACDPS